MSGCDNSNIRKNYIVSGVEIDILSACTGFYTNNIYNCSGDTIFIDPTFLDANNVIADTLSACTAIYTSNLYGCSPINVNDELYILSGLFLSGTPTTNTAIDVLVRDTNGEVKIRDIDSIISGITTSANTYVTGTTFSPNQAVLTRNDGANVFKLSGGSNVTLTNPSTNQILIDVSIPPGSNTFVTGFTYDDINTFRVSQNDNTFFDATINILSGVTYYGDGSGLTNIPVSGVTNLQTELDNKVENGDNLGGGNEVFKNKSGTTLNFRTLSGGSNTTLTTIGDTIRIDVAIPPDTNTFVTGGTYNESNDTITLTRNDAVTIDITGVTDYFTTGGTYNVTTQSIDFSGNSVETTFSVDLSSLVNNVTGDTFVTGFTYDNINTFTITRNDDFSLTSSITTLSGVTYYGDGNGLFNIPISGVTNLQTELDTKISGATNLSSEGIFAQVNGQNLEFKGLTSTGSSLNITSDSNTVNLDVIFPTDVFVYSGNANASTSELTFLNTTGGTFTVTNSAALFADNDINVTGGTYNPSTGCVTFTTNSGTTFDVCGFLTGLTDTYVTGTTFSPNQATLTRTDGVEILKLSGGSNVTLSNPSTNQILIDVTIPPDNNTFLTAFTYDNANTFTIVRNDNQTFNATINTVTGLTINGDLNVTGTTNLDVVNGNIFSGGTYYGDGSNLSGITTVDNYTTGATLVGDTLVFDRTDIQSAYTVSLSTLIVTGTTTTELFLGDEEFTINTAGRSVLTTTSTGFLSFAGAGLPDDAGVSFKIPLDYDSEPQFAVQWTMDGTSSTANTVNYNLNITTGRTTTINEHTVVSETVSIVDEAYSGTAWRILQTPFSSSTLNYSAGDYIHVELERDPGNVNDTMNDTAYVSGLIFKYKANK